MKNKIIIYGDLHGCLDEFLALRNKINPSLDDREIIIGDILDKGPFSIELLGFLRENGIESIMGNHEDKYLRYKKHYDAFVERGIEIPMGFSDEKLAIFNSLTEEDFEYLKSLPYYKKIDNLTLVHGGITNNMDLDNLSNKNLKILLRLRFLQEDNIMSHTAHKNQYNVRWSELYDGNQGIVIYGHEAYENVRYDKYAIGIDTGCVYGNILSAIVVTDTRNPMENHKIVQLDAKATYRIKLEENEVD